MPNFFDYYKLTPINNKIIDISFKDSYTQGVRPGLEVTLKATHSAIITGNKKAYIPSRMADGSASFVRRKKPAKILKHHKIDEDPVGIIVGSEYISTIPDYLKANKDVRILTDSSFSVKQQLKSLNNLRASGILSQPDWQGLGYIQLKAVILDQKSIYDVETGLFDAVSTNFQSPGEVYCSECSQNLAKDGMCEHELGRIYEHEDGTKSQCIWIPAVHDYIECSLVNLDADPLTSITFGDKLSKKTYSFTKEELSTDKVDTTTVYEFKDFQIEEENMPGETPTLSLTEEETKILDLVKTLRPEISEEDALVLVKKVLAEKKDDVFHKDQKEAELDDNTVIEYLLDYWENKDGTLDADLLYAEIEKEMDELKLEGVKLSVEDRKKLPKSTFCLPKERAIPITDNNHLVAAKGMIFKHKGPLDKIAILATLNKKAKALGLSTDSITVTTAPEAVPFVFVAPKPEDLKSIDNDTAKSLYSIVEAELISRNLKVGTECSNCSEKDSKILELTTESDELKKEKSTFEDQLKYLRAELRSQSVDYVALSDELFEAQTSLHSERAERASVLGVLSGKYKTLEEATDFYKTSDVEKEISSLTDSLDFVKITSKINDGMSRTPNGNVEDPSIPIESTLDLVLGNLSAPAKAAITHIKDFISDGKIGNAKQIYDNMVKMKHIDKKELPFEMFSIPKKIEE